MPSFYPRPSPRQAPITPPEFIPSYHTGCGGMPYQHTQYGRQTSIRQHEDGQDYADRYSQLAMALPPMYPQAGTYLNDAPPRHRPAFSTRDDTAPTLPPMRSQFGQYAHQPTYQPQYPQETHQRVAQPPKEEKPVGGVSAKLDYDMDVMTDFVCETAIDFIKPDRGTPPSFRKWVHQVLCATRLPSATILLSMYYLSQRMSMLRGRPQSETDLYRMLTLSLVLGSKFLDDNTFINRSWSEVSRIPVADLNRLETEWLLAIEFRLHRDPTEQNGWNTWSTHWKGYERSATARASKPIKLDPIDTFLGSRPPWLNQNKPLPALPMPQQNYGLPPPYESAPKSAQPLSNSGHYDHWRSANEYSPPSAVTTGPTTPEYLGSVGPWAQAEAYSRRTMFGYPSQPQPTPPKHLQRFAWAPASNTPSQHQQHFGWTSSAFSGPYTAPAWGHHGWGVPQENCHCMGCMQYMRPQVLAV